MLVHDDTLWEVIDGWLRGLPAEAFETVLPLLRRTFSAYEPGERRSIGERARRGGAGTDEAEAEAGWNHARGLAVLPRVLRLLGVQHPRELAAKDAQQYAMGYIPVVMFDLWKKYKIAPIADYPTGPGFVTKETAASVIDLAKQGKR